MGNLPTDAELDALWHNSNPTNFEARSFARAVLAKWGTPPAVEGEPFGYFHQLLDHEGKGNDVWLGTKDREVVVQSHTPGETGDEIVALYTTPQPTQAQAGAGEPVGYCHEIKWRAHQSEQVQKITRKAQPEYGYVHALYIKGGPHGADT